MYTYQNALIKLKTRFSAQKSITNSIGSNTRVCNYKKAIHNEHRTVFFCKLFANNDFILNRFVSVGLFNYIDTILVLNTLNDKWKDEEKSTRTFAFKYAEEALPFIYEDNSSIVRQNILIRDDDMRVYLTKCQEMRHSQQIKKNILHEIMVTTFNFIDYIKMLLRVILLIAFIPNTKKTNCFDPDFPRLSIHEMVSVINSKNILIVVCNGPSDNNILVTISTGLTHNLNSLIVCYRKTFTKWHRVSDNFSTQNPKCFGKRVFLLLVKFWMIFVLLQKFIIQCREWHEHGLYFHIFVYCSIWSKWSLCKMTS